MGGSRSNVLTHCPPFDLKALPILRHLIFIMFHQHLPRFQSEYHLRIIFDQSQYQNIHSQSKNCCFKEVSHFLVQNMCYVYSARMCAKGGIESVFGQFPRFYICLDFLNLGNSIKLFWSIVNFNVSAINIYFWMSESDILPLPNPTKHPKIHLLTRWVSRLDFFCF